MNKADLEAQRKRILAHFGNLVDTVLLIEGELKDAPRHRGAVHRSLKPHSGAYILSHPIGFTAVYQDKDGQWYEMSIHRRDYPKKAQTGTDR